MSRKNDYLLQHAGRDQFGDPGGSNMPATLRDLTQQQYAAAHAANRRFAEEFGAAWAVFTAGKTSREIWEAMFDRGVPAFSTFEKQRRAFLTPQDHHAYVLVLWKFRALMALGQSMEAARTTMRRFAITESILVEPEQGRRKPGRSPQWVAQTY